MAVEPFRSAAPYTPVPAHARAQAVAAARPVQPLAAGDTLPLRYAERVGDALRGDTPQGLSLWLSGAADWAQGLSPGDVLMLRVLSAQPRMEVELLGRADRQPAAAADAAQQEEPASMRWDQAVMQGLARRPPDAAMLAAAWQSLLRAHGLALLQAPAGPFAAQGGLAGAAAQALLPAPPAAGPWAVPAYFWGGLPLMLQVFAAQDEGEGGEWPWPRRRRAGAGARAVLRLDLTLPALGRVVLQVHAPVPGSVALLIHAQNEAALAQLRQLLPAVSLVLVQAGLRLVRCRIGLGPPQPQAGWAVQAPLWSDAMALTSDALRAAAEVATLLAPLGDLSKNIAASA